MPKVTSYAAVIKEFGGPNIWGFNSKKKSYFYKLFSANFDRGRCSFYKNT